MRTYLMILLLAIINVFSINAEPLVSIPVATLYHDGVVTQFYGAKALQNAHDAAVSGDVIILNSGNFSACTITKGITLRGACMGTTPEMEEQGMKPTVIKKFENEMRIQIPMTETNTLKIEDLCFDNGLYIDSVPHISFTRVMTKATISTTDLINNFDAVQCSFYAINPNAYFAETVYSFVNSAIAFRRIISSNKWVECLPYHVYANHCVIGRFYVHDNSDNFSYDSEFRNCIFTYPRNTNSSGCFLPVGCTVDHCVALYVYFFDNLADAANDCQISSMAELFGDQDNLAYEYGDYINPLTETAAATYLGNDGTQVGIYGGIYPFTMIPDNTVVTKCDIARKTSDDGKLKVQIEVKSIE